MQTQPVIDRHAATVIDLTALPPAHLLDDKEAAAALDTTTGTLSVWRSTGRYNLKFIRIGRRVKYRVGDLLEFIERRTSTSTSNTTE